MAASLALEQVAVERATVIDGQARMLRILSDVTFTVQAGGRLGIIGPSGAGKTSLLRLLNRLDDPAEGRVLLEGEDMRRLDVVPVRRRVGMIFQQPFLFDLTVEGNLAYPLRLLRRELPREQAAALLEEFGLPAELLTRHGDQLSGGQQQRVAVARALTLCPDVLALDEPTSALDADSAQRLLDALLRRNREQGLSLVMVTHVPDIVRRLDGAALMVHAGRAQWYADANAALHAAERARVQLE